MDPVRSLARAAGASPEDLGGATSYGMEYDIIAIGSSTRDVFLKSADFAAHKHPDSPTGIEQCFPLGSKIEVKEVYFTFGGGGANAAVTFARQGLKTGCIGIVGDDFNGFEVLAALQREGVDTKHFQKNAEGHTAYSVILVSENAERTILSYKGEGQNFDVDKVPFHELKAKWLFLDSLGGHFDLLEKAVSWAAANNVKLAMNPGGKEIAHGLEKLAPLLKSFSIVIMNQEEAAKLTGIEYGKEEEIFKTMAGLVGGVFVMTKGPEGVVVSDGRRIYSAGVPDSPVVERTGAGDAFSSGFVSEYIRSLGRSPLAVDQRARPTGESGDVAKAIQFATANASSVVTQYGAWAGILKKEDWGSWPLVEVKVD